MADKKYYLIKGCTLKDIAKAIRLKRTQTLQSMYTAKDFSSGIDAIEISKTDGYCTIPLPTLEVPPVSSSLVWPTSKQQRIYLWDYEAADPTCSAVTGGWDLGQTKGLSNSGAAAAQQTSNKLSIKTAAAKGGSRYSSVNLTANSTFDIASLKAAGYSTITIQAEHFYENGTSSTATTSRAFIFDVIGTWAQTINTKTASAATAYTNYEQDFFAEKVTAKTSTAIVRLRNKPMPDKMTIPLPEDSSMKNFSLTLYNHGENDLWAPTGSTTSYSTGARILISKIYIQ